MFRRTSSRRRTMRFWFALILAGSLVALPVLTLSHESPSGRNKSSRPMKHADKNAEATTESRTNAAAQAHDAFGNLPLQFEANYGQTDSSVKFITRGGGATTFLTPTAAVFVLSTPDKSAVGETPQPDLPTRLSREHLPASSKVYALRMNLAGASATAQAEGLDRLPGIVNYFIGSEPAEWHTEIPTFARVQFAGVYPGVDLVYYGSQQQLEYDFIVKPGADASRIDLNFGGADSLTLDSSGDLLIGTPLGTMRQRRPYVYQEVGGERREVGSGYEIKGGGRVGFHVGGYDRAKPLIIDPVLIYSTYLGGAGNDVGGSIVLDSADNAYVTGFTNSLNFPTTSPIQPSLDGDVDAFVTKINAAGTALIYSTYLGGDGADFGGDIAVDSAGNAYITGNTPSTDFPTMNPIQPSLSGSADAFVTKINAAGSALIYSTYLGGSGGGDFDSGHAIALDSARNAYVTRHTRSVNFPTVNPIQASLSGSGDAFVTKINAAGSALIYSTYLGGSSGGTDGEDEAGNDIAVDGSGNSYISGSTASTDFPTANPIQPANRGLFDAFITKINAAGSALIYSTYLGGDANDQSTGIALDPAGNAYTTGTSDSLNFPTTNPIQPTNNSGGGDAFVTKINAAGSARVYSTYLGGTGFDGGTGIAVDSAGNAYVTGNTDSDDFPTTNPIQPTFGGADDAFVTKINAAGMARVYSTYLGGSDGDASTNIAVDSGGNAYVTGNTTSDDFPTIGPPQPALGSGDQSDAFITKIGNLIISGSVIDTNGNGLANVNILLNGTDAAVTQTDANGNFQFLIPNPGGDYIVTPAEQGFVFSPESISITNLTANRQVFFVGASMGGSTSALVQFEFAHYIAPESCGEFVIAVTRGGNTTSALSVDYATADDTAKQKSDYSNALGTLSFAPGETRKTINLLISEDAFVEGDEKFTLNLFNVSGTGDIAEPSRTVITITDDDTTPGVVNPIDNSLGFVCQHYHDFLNREADIAGEAFWTNNIESCGADTQCREQKRIDTSAAFFLSIEFQQTGYLVYRFYNAALNRPNGLPRYQEFLFDTQHVGRGIVVGATGWEAALEASKVAYATDFAGRVEYSGVYPLSQTSAQHVDALYAHAGITPTAAERQAAIDEFGVDPTSADAAARGRVLRRVVENQTLSQREFNRAFVLMQYFGYLRRNPDDQPDTNIDGYNFWLTKLNSFNGDFRAAEMVKSFILSSEYRLRFGP